MKEVEEQKQYIEKIRQTNKSNVIKYTILTFRLSIKRKRF